MRTFCLAAVVAIVGVAPAAYAQGQATTTMMVSVRVVRSCNVDVEGARITAQCAGPAQPQTQVSAIVRTPIATVATTSPAVLERAAAGATETPAYRVVTVNY